MTRTTIASPLAASVILAGGGSSPRFVYAKTNEAFVADGYGNRRVIVLDADTGAFKRMWGAFGNAPLDPPPAAPAPIPPGGSAAAPRPPLDEGGPGPQQFGIVHGINAVDSKGTLYTAEVSPGRRFQKFVQTGGSPAVSSR